MIITGGLIVKIFGLVDIITALVILFGPFAMPLFLKMLIVSILFIKGVPSIFGDITCKFDAVFDLSSAVIILAALVMPDILKIVIAGVMVLKGGTSLI